MKKLNLSVIIFFLAAIFTLPVSAAVTVNGTAINEVRLNGVVVTNLSIVQNGETLTISSSNEPNPCADPQSETCPGSPAFCAVNPTSVSCPGSTAFCSANPADVSCPGSPAFCAVPANAGHSSCVVTQCPAGITVFETINWASQPSKITVTTGRAGVASKLVTSSSNSYKGYFIAVADTLSSSLTRRMWFSECPGGAPIVRNYTSGGVVKNACDVSGAEPKLTWSQEVTPSLVTQCKLEPSKRYYLNYKQSKFGSGPEPTSTSKFYRGSNTNRLP